MIQLYIFIFFSIIVYHQILNIAPCAILGFFVCLPWCMTSRGIKKKNQGFPDSSVGKEFTCNAGDPGLIHGSGRSAGEGIGYPLQDSWASLVAQLVENPPAMWETWWLR